MKAYKLLRKRKNGTLGPLFINRKQIIPINKWLPAEEHRTKGYKFRPGWHTVDQPTAPHLSMNGRAWYEVEIENFYKLSRPKSQGGTWFIARKIKIIERVVNEN